jgi:hypothetical protein
MATQKLKKVPTPPAAEEVHEDVEEEAVHADVEEDVEQEVQERAKPVPRPDVHPSLAKYTEAELKRMRENVHALNERIKAFRSLGWELHLDGLHEPATLVAKQTGTRATILIDGRSVYLNVGQNRTHNALIKQLGGVWRAEKSSWRLDIDKLTYIRGSFVIEDERNTGAPPSLQQGSTSSGLYAPRGTQVQEREVVLIPAGDAVVIRGYTRPIKDELKLVAPGMRWNGEETYWTAKKQYYGALVSRIEELIQDKRLDSYRVGDAEEL